MSRKVFSSPLRHNKPEDPSHQTRYGNDHDSSVHDVEKTSKTSITEDQTIKTKDTKVIPNEISVAVSTEKTIKQKKEEEIKLWEDEYKTLGDKDLTVREIEIASGVPTKDSGLFELEEGGTAEGSGGLDQTTSIEAVATISTGTQDIKSKLRLDEGIPLITIPEINESTIGDYNYQEVEPIKFKTRTKKVQRVELKRFNIIIKIILKIIIKLIIYLI